MFARILFTGGCRCCLRLSSACVLKKLVLYTALHPFFCQCFLQCRSSFRHMFIDIPPPCGACKKLLLVRTQSTDPFWFSSLQLQIGISRFDSQGWSGLWSMFACSSPLWGRKLLDHSARGSSPISACFSCSLAVKRAYDSQPLMPLAAGRHNSHWCGHCFLLSSNACCVGHWVCDSAGGA